MKLYLAGPMTGIPEYNFPEFARVTGILRERGFDIASPHEIDHGETDETRGSLPYETYLLAGLKLLLDCDGLILMSGWVNSKGAREELNLANAVRMDVYFYESKTDVLQLAFSGRKR